MSASPAATPDQHATAAAAPQAHRSSSCSSRSSPPHTSVIKVLRRPVESALRAAITVENDPALRPTLPQGHRQGVGDQLGAHVVGDRPPDHPPRVQVDHGRQVHPAVPTLHIGDVAAPPLITLPGGEVPADQVRRRHRPLAVDRGLLPRPRMASLQASTPHQPPHPLGCHPMALGGKLGVDPPHPRVALQPLEDHPEEAQQRLTGPSPR